jgi:hypothetical protein
MLNTASQNRNDVDTESRTVIDELNNAVASGNVQQRLRMLQRVTDLFVAGARGYSGQQIALFDDVLQQLTADIEVKVRAQLAQRLARIESAPPKLIRRLAFDDEIEVARPVLVHSVQLTDADLVENATIKSQEHLFAIAQRLKLSEAVTDVLVQRGDDRVAQRIVKNEGARFSLAGYERLTIRARRNDTLTLLLGQRSDIPRQYFLKLLESASAAVRAKLEAANPKAAAVIRDTVDDIATALQQETRAASRPYANALRNGKRRFRADHVTEANVHGPARAQEFERTVVALTRLGRLPVDLVERALVDEGEDMILILAKAAGCSWTTVRELLLMYIAGRQLDSDELAQAFERYSKLSQQTARKVVDFYVRRTELRSQKEMRAGPAVVQDVAEEPSTAHVPQPQPIVPRDPVPVKVPA